MIHVHGMHLASYALQNDGGRSWEKDERKERGNEQKKRMKKSKKELRLASLDTPRNTCLYVVGWCWFIERARGRTCCTIDTLRGSRYDLLRGDRSACKRFVWYRARYAFGPSRLNFQFSLAGTLLRFDNKDHRAELVASLLFSARLTVELSRYCAALAPCRFFLIRRMQPRDVLATKVNDKTETGSCVFNCVVDVVLVKVRRTTLHCEFRSSVSSFENYCVCTLSEVCFKMDTIFNLHVSHKWCRTRRDFLSLGQVYWKLLSSMTNRFHVPP